MAKINRCDNFRRYKGIYQPSCGDAACWDFYFRMNPGKVMAAASAIKQLGEETVAHAQGAQYFDDTRFERVQAIIAGTRHGVNRDAIIEGRGQTYVKHLKRWLKNNPVPEYDYVPAVDDAPPVPVAA